MKPLFSIMIPTFNRPQLLIQAIRSALAQRGGADIEVVVVDNDADGQYGAAAVVDGFDDARLRYVRNERNLGMCGNWNRCVELAAADWLTILHDDDLLHPDYLDGITGALRAAPDLSAIGCGVHELSNGNYEIGAPAAPGTVAPLMRLNRCDILRCCPYYVAGVALRRQDVLAVGGFDPDQYPSMDYDMWFRLFKNGNIGLLGERLAVYRKFENESARADVLAGFLQRSHAIRSETIDSFGAPWRTLLRIYSDVRVAGDAAVLKANWGVEPEMAWRVDDVAVGPGARLLYKIVKIAVVLASARRFYRLAA